MNTRDNENQVKTASTNEISSWSRFWAKMNSAAVAMDSDPNEFTHARMNYLAETVSQLEARISVIENSQKPLS